MKYILEKRENSSLTLEVQWKDDAEREEGGDEDVGNDVTLEPDK